MKNHKILLLSLFYCILNYSLLSAQDGLDKRENSYSLLWKIEGDSLKKPSYLFGTMHVRNKLAFSFSDSVLVKLLNADVFASEYDIDTMTIHAIRKGVIEAENRILFEEDFTESELKKLKDNNPNKNVDLNDKFFKNKSFKELKEYFDNFETYNNNLMPTYVDAYLYQFAKDNGKHVMGMESVESGYSLLDTISWEGQKEYITSKLDSLPYFINSKEQMLNLYHRGNIDSIWQFYDNNWYYLKKVMLDNRNVIMVDTLEDIMKEHSVFIAAGAAHLPGDSGLIQLFKNKGYSVSKVNATFTGLADSLMETFSQKPRKWYTYIDSSKHYSIEVPNQPTNYELFGGLFKMNISQDILNNSTYYFYAVPKVLSGTEKEEDVLKLAKKAFGEKKNIDIVSKKKIDFNGIQGYEFVLKSGQVLEAMAKIYMYNDYLFLQMVGNSEANYKSDEAKHFFESFKTFGKVEHNKNTWTKYTYNNGAFSVKLPYEPSYMKKEVPDNEGVYQKPYYFHMYTCINQTDKELYILRWNDLPEGYYYDNYNDIYQETFASIFGDDYIFDPEKEIKLDAGAFQGFETNNTLKENSFEIRSRVYIRGNRMYLLLGQYLTGNSDSKVDEFFNSFEGNQFLKTEYNACNLQGINIKLPTQPVTTDDSETSEWSYSDIPYKTFASTDPNNGLLFTVTVNMYPKYFFTPSADSLLKKIEEEMFYQNEISDTKAGQDNHGVYYRSGMVTEEDSPNKIQFKYFLNGNKSYEICTYISEELLHDSLQNTVYNSISFDSAYTDFDIFRKKTDLIFADLRSNDNTTFSMAKKALSYHLFDSTDIPSLYKALAFNYPDSTDSWGSTKEKILNKIKENHDEHAVSVLKDSYQKDHGSKVDILLAISEIDSFQKRLVYNLLAELPDTSVSDYKLYALFNYLADSSVFFKEKINELITINKNTSDDEALIGVINENFNTLKLGQEQLISIADHCTDLYNLSYDSLLTYDEESLYQYQYIKLMRNVLGFFVYDTSNNYDVYVEKADKIDIIGIQAKVNLYMLCRGKKINSSKIKKIIADPEYGWGFLTEASQLYMLSRINKKLINEENLAFAYLSNAFYWEDFIPEKVKLIEKRKIKMSNKEYTYYIYTFSDSYDEPYLAITGGFQIIDGKLLHDDIIFNYSYETFDSEARKEEIILELISIYQEDAMLQ